MRLWCAISIALVWEMVSHIEQIQCHRSYYRSRVKDNRPKYVLTSPDFILRSQDYPLYMVLFRNETYSLPINFTAVLFVAGTSQIEKSFVQERYGLQKHIIPGAELSNLTDGSRPRLTVRFNTRGFTVYPTFNTYPDPLRDRFVFIQTDRAMYKPTQTVLFRVVVLARDLTPANGNISVTIKDPRRKLLHQWQDQRLTKGVFNGSYALSDFVEEGKWAITARGPDILETKQTITVRQYVLPKYEVGLEFSNLDDGKNYWLFNGLNETGYKGFVRAKYTFGRPLRGTAVVSFVKQNGCPGRDTDYATSTTGMTVTAVTAEGETEAVTERARVLSEVQLAGDGSKGDGEFTASGLAAYLWGSHPPFMARSSCRITLRATVTDELTGEEMSSDATVSLYREPIQLSVHGSVQNKMKPGLPFTMTFQVSHPSGATVGAGVKVALAEYLCKGYNSYARAACYGSCPGWHVSPTRRSEAITDREGLVSITVNVTKDISSAMFRARILKAGLHRPVAEICQRKSLLSNGRFIAISVNKTNERAMPKVGDTLDFSISANFEAPFVYLLVSQNGFAIHYKQLSSPTTAISDETKYTEAYQLPLETAPRCTALVWTFDNKTGQLLASAVQFTVDGLVKQNVSASFSPDAVRPKSATNLTISTSEPHSLVGVLAVDKSVRLLSSGNDITMNDVIKSVSGSNDAGSDASMVVDTNMFHYYYQGYTPHTTHAPVYTSTGYADDLIYEDSSSALRTSRLPMGNAPPRRPAPPPPAPSGVTYSTTTTTLRPGSWTRTTLARSESDDDYYSEPESAGDQSDEPRVRLLFPETWLWNQSETNGHGKLVFPLTAPDTISTWEASAFAIGERQGFGVLDQPVELNVFQDFFVELDIRQPTIIRDEQVEAKAVVFNYQSVKTRVRLRIDRSPDFQVSQDGGTSFSNSNFRRAVEVEPNSGSSISVWIKPKTLGTIKIQLKGYGQISSDAMIKEILVEPEGEAKYANQAVFLWQKPNETIAKAIDISRMLDQIPEETVVEGSKMFQIQAFGTTLGPALTHLGSLVRLPTGCGEQIMVNLAPNVYIYKYLKSVGQLTDALKAKTSRFVQQGYQKELTYQREDGGFSAFGSSDQYSSTWLTAFVLRCFAAAKKHVGTAMEERPIGRAWAFISQQAQPSGMFTESGRVMNRAMMGSSRRHGNLAAFVYAAAAEADVDMSKYDATKNRIRRLSRGSDDPYQLALMTYALSIRGLDKPTARKRILRLKRAATMDGDRMYWKENRNGADEDEYYRAAPTGIETAAYALLAELNLNGMSVDAIAIGRWLMSQRNSLGGFASTQDTVVGLQALAELASHMSPTLGQGMAVDAILNFGSGEMMSHSFTINSSNSQILQSFDPPRDKQNLVNVILSSRGSGSGMVQVAMRYNVQDRRVLDTGNFNISIVRSVLMARKKRSASEVGLHDPHVALRACVRPTKPESQMVMYEVGIPTGFEGDLVETMKANRNSSGSGYNVESLKRIESGEKKIVFYFDSLEETRSPTCVQVRMTRTMPVKNARPPMARAYAYYTPAKINAVEFTFPGLSFHDRAACQDPNLNIPCPT